MKKYSFYILTALLIGQTGLLTAQVKKSKSVGISFYSEKKDLLSPNNKATSTLDTKTGEIIFEVPVKNFEIENETMKQHFLDEGVMDEKNFPTATFEGKIDSVEAVKWKTDSVYEVTVTGILTIKGNADTITQAGTIQIKDGEITASSSFSLDRFLFGVEGKATFISQLLAIKVDAVY